MLWVQGINNGPLINLEHLQCMKIETLGGVSELRAYFARPAEGEEYEVICTGMKSYAMRDHIVNHLRPSGSLVPPVLQEVISETMKAN